MAKVARKKPLTLRTLRRNTPAPIRGRAGSQCKQAQFLGWHNGKDVNGNYKQATYLVQCTDGNRRSVIRFYGNISGKAPVWCSCSCPFFLYYLEVALTKRNSSSIIYSNGKYPSVRNPNLRPYLCKHLWLMARLVLQPKAQYNETKASRKIITDNIPQQLWDLVGSSKVDDLRENRERK